MCRTSETRETNELVERTGGDPPSAATKAGLEPQSEAPAEGDGFEDKVIQIGRECASRLKEPYLSADHGELLYDEVGLPK